MTRKALLSVLIAGILLQTVISGLQHAAEASKQDVESVDERKSIVPHVRWANNETGIDLMPLLEFMNASAGSTGYDPYQPDCLYMLEKRDPDSPKQDTKGKVYPETNFSMSMNGYWKHKVSFRRRELTTNLDFIDACVDRMEQDWSLWPRLHRAIMEEGGFPFYINWDSMSHCQNACCDELYPLDRSRNIATGAHVPVMRLLAPRHCKYRLFVPTARLIQIGKERPEEWTDSFLLNEQRYTKANRTNKVVWRGNNSAVDAIVQRRADLFDVLKYNENDPNADSERLQEHAVVLDVDSIRYQYHMCQNSVVLRAESEGCRDMYTHSLEPWLHFVPVKEDLSDLEEQAQYVLDPANADRVDEIVKRANHWCRQKLINHKLEHHFLTTLTRYLEELDKADPEWPKKWNELRETYLAGHFILTRPTAWALPKDVVGAIKGGLRRDDGRYDHSTGELDGRKLADWKG